MRKKKKKKRNERLIAMRFLNYLTIMCILNTHHYQEKNDDKCLIRCAAK